MCGIAGAVGLIDDRMVEAVRRADEAQRHRGPDANGFWRDGHVALAQRRLAILDLSPAGAQPMIEPRTGCTIVFNGEVYNYRTIRADLQSLGWDFHSDCDTEVILKAYVQWGPECVHRFRGMFAYAIWNPAERTLHLARDRVGIKPLYYGHVMQPDGAVTLVFASELRAMLASGLFARKIDRTGLATYLWHGFVVGPGTLIEGISLLPQGTHITVHAGEMMPEPRRYWSIPSAGASATDTEGALREELAEAVKLRLIADVPLGVFLSGGVDSSAVAALAVKVSGHGDAVKTFNISFDEPEYDESRYAVAVAEALHTAHTDIRLTESMFKAQLDAALASIDQPTFDHVNSYFVSRAVRDAGMTVALAGTGGDELFGGYRSFADIPKAMAWGRRLSAVPEPMLRAAAGAMTRVKAGGATATAVPPQTRWGKLGDALATRGDLVRLYQLAYALFTPALLRQLADPAITDAAPMGLTPAVETQFNDMVRNEPTRHAISMLELSSFIGERLMRDTDAASMSVALEVRVPLLDHELIGRVAAMDEQRRFLPSLKKQLLREMALQSIDPAIFDRPKSGFVLPIDTWCRRGLRDRVGDMLRDRGMCERVGLRPDTVGRLLHAFESGAPGIYWSRLWSLFVLLWWCDRHEVAL
jgi:asparagine synthase (glutamine-hydrolysing)